MPPEFGGKWEADCLNTRVPLSTLLHEGYSVKLMINLFKYVFIVINLTLEQTLLAYYIHVLLKNKITTYYVKTLKKLLDIAIFASI